MPEAWLDTATIVAGLAVLVVGGELLVRGAVALAAAMRVPSVVIGLTVVAFGTSSPELAVNLRAAYAGNADVGVGNVVGTNIFNVLFILGISALIAPLVVHNQLIRRDAPLMILASVNRNYFDDDRVAQFSTAIFAAAGGIDCARRQVMHEWEHFPLHLVCRLDQENS
jgi:cation:H+ antiporter